MERSSYIDGDMPCECLDKECPVHFGDDVCNRQSAHVLYEIARGDYMGTVLCPWCLLAFCREIVTPPLGKEGRTPQ